MGRFILLLVASGSVVAALASVGGLELRQAKSALIAQSEGGSIARQAALSGLAITERELIASFGTEATHRDVQIEGGTFGTYDADIETAPGGMTITVTGRFGVAAHTFTAFFEETLDVPAALMVYGSAISPKVDKTAAITGAVSRPPSIPAVGWSASGRPAIAGVATPAALQAIFTDKLKAEELARITGSVAFTNTAPPGWIRAVADEVEAHPSATVVEKYELKNATAGSAANPVFIVATKEVKIENGTGYGVILLRRGGKVEIKKGSRWEGLILVESVDGEKDVKVEFKMDEGSTIYGAVVGFGIEADPGSEVSPSGPGPGLAGGHFDLDFFVGDASGIDRAYHKHEYDDRYDLTYLDFLNGPDIKDSYATFRGLYGHKTLDIEFYNEFNGSGTYAIGPYAGLVRGDLSISARPNDLSPFIVNFVNLQELRGSNPGTVKGDLNRDRSFSVRFYDKGTLVYEVTAYEHAKAFRDGIPTGSLPGALPTEDGSATADPSLIYGEFKVELGKNSGVYWAPDVLSRLTPELTALRDAIGIQRRLVGDAAAL